MAANIARIQFRRDTVANWLSVDPVLASGEVGYESDTGYYRVGDGSTTFSILTKQGGYQAFDTVALLQSDTTLTTSNTTAGDIIEAQGIQFSVVSSGGDITTAGGVQLDYVQTQTPAFQAGLTTDMTSSGTIIFDSVLLNTHSDYDGSTGVFTASIAGVYSIKAQSRSTSSSDRATIEIYINGVLGSRAINNSDTNNHASANCEWLGWLNKGDTIYAKNTGTAQGNVAETKISGHRV